VFLVGLEGDDTLLTVLDEAVKSPVFPLYLGRRSCPPCGIVTLGIRKGSLRESLVSEDWIASEWYKRKALRKTDVFLTLVCDAECPGAFYRRDLPVSFDQTHRKYTFRSVHDAADAVLIKNSEFPTDHDPFSEMGERADVFIEN
jgi:CRISPR system Cascade subunit CasD